jgi:hypothetical protein
MTHKTYDKNAKLWGDESFELEVKVLEDNAKQEAELFLKNGAIKDDLGRIPIIVTYDGNWAKRSYNHSYNSLLGGGWMVSLYCKQPIVNCVLNKYCMICALNNKHEHDCSKNWEKSAKSMEAEIAIRCCFILNELGIIVKSIVGDEDATVISQLKSRLLDDLPGTGCSMRDITKYSDLNHIKKNLGSKLRELWSKKWKNNGLTQIAIDHLVHNFSFAIQTNKMNEKAIGQAI